MSKQEQVIQAPVTPTLSRRDVMQRGVALGALGLAGALGLRVNRAGAQSAPTICEQAGAGAVVEVPMEVDGEETIVKVSCPVEMQEGETVTVEGDNLTVEAGESEYHVFDAPEAVVGMPVAELGKGKNVGTQFSHLSLVSQTETTADVSIPWEVNLANAEPDRVRIKEVKDDDGNVVRGQFEVHISDGKPAEIAFFLPGSINPDLGTIENRARYSDGTHYPGKDLDISLRNFVGEFDVFDPYTGEAYKGQTGKTANGNDYADIQCGAVEGKDNVFGIRISGEKKVLFTIGAHMDETPEAHRANLTVVEESYKEAIPWRAE